MNSNPNMTLLEFVKAFGSIEPSPQQQMLIRAIERGVRFPSNMLHVHPRRREVLAAGELTHRPVAGGKVKDCTTGEVHEPTWTHRELDQR